LDNVANQIYNLILLKNIFQFMLIWIIRRK